MKSTVLSEVKFFTMQEGPVNCGVIYSQGSAPDGPATYAAAEVVLRNLRWTEDPKFSIKTVYIESSGFVSEWVCLYT
jgi:hypothetical protein